MKRSNLVLLCSALSLFLLVMAGCGQKEYKPVAIEAGVDRCDVCNMLVPDDHNATQLILKDGKALKFDDIGCLFTWTEEHGLDDVAVRFVRDYSTEQWFDMNKATFVFDPEFETPMSYGIYSFIDKAEAEKFITEQQKGVLYTLDDLQNHTWERYGTHGQHGSMDGHGMDAEHGHDDEQMDGHDMDAEHGDEHRS